MVSDIIGVSVVSSHTEKRVAGVHDAIFDPENGTLLALSVASGRKRIIATKDIQRISSREVLVRDKEAIVPIEEVLRVKKVSDERRRFRFNKVYTELGQYLGRVVDVDLQLPGMFLSELRVSKKLFFLFSGPERVVKKKDIIEVKRSSIVVRKSSLLKEAEAPGFISAAAS